MADMIEKVSPARLLGAILAALLLLAACGGDDDSDEESGPTSESVGEPTDDDEENEGAVQSKTMELDVDPITVGAFVVTFTELEIVPSEFDDDFYTVNLAFTAENEMPDILTPLDIGSSSIVLETETGFLTGARVDVSDVPGGRTGAGTLAFDGSTSDIDVSDISSATLVFGTADQNQPSVALDGSAIEPFSTIPVDLTVDDVSGVTRFQIDGGTVVFRDAFGGLLDQGRAILSMPLITSATDQTGAGGEYIGPDRVFIDRPDGTSLAPEYLNRAVYPGDQVEEPMEFQLQEPLEGEYTINIGEEITITFTVD